MWICSVTFWKRNWCAPMNWEVHCAHRDINHNKCNFRKFFVKHCFLRSTKMEFKSWVESPTFSRWIESELSCLWAQRELNLIWIITSLGASLTKKNLKELLHKYVKETFLSISWKSMELFEVPATTNDCLLSYWLAK